MKENSIYIILLLMFFVSCQDKNRNDGSIKDLRENSLLRRDSINIDTVDSKKVRAQTAQNSFRNYFRSDSTFDKNILKSSVAISNGEETKMRGMLCNCDKNVKNNSIKIQITMAMPTGAEIKKGRRDDRLFSSIALSNNFKVQLKFLTFYLKDSTINKIQLLSKSTAEEYHGSDFKYADIEKYQITISKFDYSIASNIYGKYKVILPESFGYFENDTILEGTFKCNNWQINEFDDVKKWDLKKWNKARNKSYGFRIIE